MWYCLSITDWESGKILSICFVDMVVNDQLNQLCCKGFPICGINSWHGVCGLFQKWSIPTLFPDTVYKSRKFTAFFRQFHSLPLWSAEISSVGRVWLFFEPPSYTYVLFSPKRFKNNIMHVRILHLSPMKLEQCNAKMWSKFWLFY